MKIEELFEVEYGNKRDYNKMTPDPSGVLFVGRSGRRQGVAGRVALIPDLAPYPAGLLTVALGGSTLSTFVQTEPFYTAQNVAVLTPRAVMTLDQKLFWATCIEANRFRYETFGREANRTLSILELPDAAPNSPLSVPVTKRLATLVPTITASDPDVTRGPATVGDLFDVRYGQSLELNASVRAVAPKGVNFVSRTEQNNGVSARVELPSGVTVGRPGELTVALGGNSVLSTFLQIEPFVCGRDVAILAAKFEMSDAEKLYWAMCILANRYRFSYGRQANRTLAALRLPALPRGLATAEVVNRVTNQIRHGFEDSSTVGV
jgi:hypothetical protein